MSCYFLAAVVCLSPLIAAAEGSYIEEYYAARDLKETDPAAAAEGMLRSFHLAVSARNSDYATSAGLNACYLLYQKGNVVATGTLAREIIDALQPLASDSLDHDSLRRVQLFGFLERGLLTEGKIGRAWQANRAAAETIRGKKVPADADGPSITLAEVIRLRPELRSYGWRLIERESQLLDYAGRSLDARELLDQTATFFGNDWKSKITPIEHFYAFKLLTARAVIVDFLGDQQAALQAQQDLIATGQGIEGNLQSYLTLRLNRLRNVSQWDGPSEELITEARTIVEAMNPVGKAGGGARLLAKMELDLKDSQEALDALHADATNSASLGAWLDATYADRDNLVNRAKRGDGDLDAEFIALLKKVRAMGNKRGEPSLYREYGKYLLDKNRPAEAITLFVECLRLTRSFGWKLHEPAILNCLFDARFNAGDLAGARATLGELEAFLKANPDLPDSRRVRAETIRAIALAKLGNRVSAREALRLAREFGKNLPPYQIRWLTAEEETAIMAAVPLSAKPSEPAHADLPPLHVQPLEILSIASPGEAARTRFTLFNPTVHGIQGHLNIQGPGAIANDLGDRVRFVAGQPEATLEISRTIPSGAEAVVEVSLAAGPGTTEAKVRAAWQNPDQASGPLSTWEVSWDPAAKRSVVLDASRLEANPFRSVALYHELALPAGEAIGIPFRLRSPLPLRFEYYDSDTQALLAVDANGNGDFTETGDLHRRGPNDIAAAILAIPPTGGRLAVEVRIFAADGLPLIPAASTCLLEAEVYRDGAWSKEAEDTLK